MKRTCLDYELVVAVAVCFCNKRTVSKLMRENRALVWRYGVRLLFITNCSAMVKLP